jgi:hypothetical protein
MKLFNNPAINRSLHTTTTRHTIVIYAIAAVVIVVMTILLFGSAMQDFDHDENNYCAAGALIASGKVMYRDFAFLQMPMLPVIYAFLFTLFKTTNYLFVGRVFSVTCSILTMLLVLVAFLHAFSNQRIHGIVLGIAAVVLYAFNQEIRHAGNFAWNHSLPILCILLAYLILASLDFSTSFNIFPLFLVGFLNGVAIVTRISFAFAGLVFFLVVAFLIPVSRSIRSKKLLLPFLAGVILPSAVAIYYFFQAPDSFIFDTIQYFRITGAQSWFPGWQATISFKEKLLMCFNILTSPSYLAPLVLFFLSCILAVSTYRHLGWRKAPLVLSSSLVAANLIAAFVVTPMHVQYFAAPVPFLLCTMAYAVSGNISAIIKEERKKLILYLSAVLIVLSAVLVILYDEHTLEKIKIAFSKKDWIPSKVYIISKEISEIVGSNKIILTLAPIFVLEGGERIYQELSTGPFLFRYGRFLSDNHRRIAVSTESRSLPALLQKKPPDAVLVGFEGGYLEAPLIEYANNSGWQRKAIGEFLLYLPSNSN